MNAGKIDDDYGESITMPYIPLLFPCVEGIVIFSIGIILSRWDDIVHPRPRFTIFLSIDGVDNNRFQQMASTVIEIQHRFRWSGLRGSWEMF